MSDAAGLIFPPAPKVHGKPLSSLRLITAMLRNPLTAYSVASFSRETLRIRVLGRTSVHVNHPDGVKHVLTANAANYTRPVSVLRSSRWIMGDGLFLAEGEAWRSQRRMLAPLFSPGHIGDLLPHFLAAGRSLMARLDKQAEATLSVEFNQAALDAVLRALFSSEANPLTGNIARLARHYLAGPGRPGLGDIIAEREDDFAVLAGSRRRFRTDWCRTIDAVVGKRSQPDAKLTSRGLLDILLAARDPDTGASLSTDEVRDQTATMLFAGFETTARLLSWAAYLLALDQREQALVRKEVTAFRPNLVGNLHDLENWPRLKCVLLEALRLYPPVPHLIRQAIGADQVCGERIDPGDMIWIAPWTLHRHHDHWEYPTAFNPARFGGQAQPWLNGAFIPFGAGPRICIGASFAMAEALILMATLLERHSIELIDQRPVLPVGQITTAQSYEPRYALNK